jgi:hypothetical protein
MTGAWEKWQIHSKSDERTKTDYLGRPKNKLKVNIKSLRQADHSSRGVLPTVVCLTECDRAASKMRRRRPSLAVEPLGGGGIKMAHKELILTWTRLH